MPTKTKRLKTFTAYALVKQARSSLIAYGHIMGKQEAENCLKMADRPSEWRIAKLRVVEQPTPKSR